MEHLLGGIYDAFSVAKYVRIMHQNTHQRTPCEHSLIKHKKMHLKKPKVFKCNMSFYGVSGGCFLLGVILYIFFLALFKSYCEGYGKNTKKKTPYPECVAF